MYIRENDKYIHTKIIQEASKDIPMEEINSKLDYVFDKLVLNYAKTLVINLPGSCNANCSYCIDKKLRKHTASFSNFMKSIDQLIDQQINFKEISITGGNLPSYQFNKLIELFHNMYPNAVITWNTNGIGLSEYYNVRYIKHINLHRNAIDEEKNKKIFKTNKDIITIEKAKEIFGEKLNLRITVDDNFDLDKYINLGVPLYINKLLPGNKESNEKYNNVLNKLNVLDIDTRRRNNYINTLYNNIPVRVCVGDKQATHVPGRYPIWLNVIIVHRSGIITGSWFEDDKVLYTP